MSVDRGQPQDGESPGHHEMLEPRSIEDPLYTDNATPLRTDHVNSYRHEFDFPKRAK